MVSPETLQQGGHELACRAPRPGLYAVESQAMCVLARDQRKPATSLLIVRGLQEPHPITTPSLVFTPPSKYSFQMTVVDTFQHNGHILYLDTNRLTGCLELAYSPNGTSSQRTKNQLRCYFSRFGASEHISTDGGMNLVSEVTTVFKTWGVTV